MTIAELPSVVAKPSPVILSYNPMVLDSDPIGLVFNPHVKPPFSTLDRKHYLDDFWRLLNRERPDLLDQSAASYDMALASLGVSAGLSDQEIVNILIYNRRTNGDVLWPRAAWGDYYSWNLTRARNPAKQAKAQERLLMGGRALADLSILLGDPIGGNRIEILDLVKHLGDPPDFWMETSAGSITLGAVNNILDQGRFLAAVAASTKLVLETCKKKAWAFRAQAILLCCREVELGEASHPGSEMGHWVETYLDTQTILDDQNIAAEQGLPFRKDGAVMFPLSGLRQHLRFSVGEQLSTHKMGQRLRLCGIEPTVIRACIKGKETSRNYWAYICG